MAETDPAKIAYYIYTVEPNACPDCEALDGTKFSREHLKEFETKGDACPRGCFGLVVAVFLDESGAPETAEQIRRAGGILKKEG